jgi:glycerol-3-phosphate acyltransferase PlsX
MTDLIKIAIDAMGGDNSPNKIINGVLHHHKSNKNVFYKIFGDQNKINNLILNKINKEFYEIIHTTDVVKSTDSPLEGAK